MLHVTSPIIINEPSGGLLAVETMHAIVQWLENLNVKRLVCKQETSLWRARNERRNQAKNKQETDAHELTCTNLQYFSYLPLSLELD